MGENSNAVAKKPRWIDGLKQEFKKIIWPDKKSVGRQTVAVVISSVVLCVLIALIDAIISLGLGFIL